MRVGSYAPTSRTLFSPALSLSTFVCSFSLDQPTHDLEGAPPSVYEGGLLRSSATHSLLPLLDLLRVSQVPMFRLGSRVSFLCALYARRLPRPGRGALCVNPFSSYVSSPCPIAFANRLRVKRPYHTLASPRNSAGIAGNANSAPSRGFGGMNLPIDGWNSVRLRLALMRVRPSVVRSTRSSSWPTWSAAACLPCLPRSERGALKGLCSQVRLLRELCALCGLCVSLFLLSSRPPEVRAGRLRGTPPPVVYSPTHPTHSRQEATYDARLE
jgi:hypothetical protein